jgi:hypothetical protein
MITIFVAYAFTLAVCFRAFVQNVGPAGLAVSEGAWPGS